MSSIIDLKYVSILNRKKTFLESFLLYTFKSMQINQLSRRFTRGVFFIPHLCTQKKQYTHTRTAFGDGNSKQESNQGPQSPFQGQRNLLMKEDFFKNPNSSLALARESRFK